MRVQSILGSSSEAILFICQQTHPPLYPPSCNNLRLLQTQQLVLTLLKYFIDFARDYFAAFLAFWQLAKLKEHPKAKSISSNLPFVRSISYVDGGGGSASHSSSQLSSS